MRLFTRSLFIALLASSAMAQAQLYKSVGPDGKVTYSDTPPATAAKVEAKAIGASSNPGTAGLPYDLALAVKSHPVTLYSGKKCTPCDDARGFLKARGIPFSEKTVESEADVEKLRQAGGDTQLPLMLIGRNKQKGFEAGAWSAALTAAGYPESSRLPASYRQPASEAAASQRKTESAGKAGTINQVRHGDERPAETQELPTPQPATGKAPPGFRF